MLDNLVRGHPREPGRGASAAGSITFIEGDVRDRGGRRDAVHGCDYVFHQAAIRITLCAEQPRECMDVLVMGAFNVFEAAVAAEGEEGRLRVLRLGLRRGRRLPDRREAPPLQQPHALRRRQGDERGHRPQLQRHVRPAERRPAVLQRLRPAHGRDRRVHRGVHPLARLHRPAASGRRSTATARRRWTSSTSRTSPAPTSSR